jgi:hypothetical protein
LLHTYDDEHPEYRNRFVKWSMVQGSGSVQETTLAPVVCTWEEGGDPRSAE